jgi:hypothetical protein
MPDDLEKFVLGDTAISASNKRNAPKAIFRPRKKQRAHYAL